jgi:hypothetical protein
VRRLRASHGMVFLVWFCRVGVGQPVKAFLPPLVTCSMALSAAYRHDGARS